MSIALKNPSCLAEAYLVHGNDLAGGLLDLLQAPQEVPVTGLGDDRVRRKDAHAVEPRGGVGLGGQMPPNDLVFVKTTYEDVSALITSDTNNLVVANPSSEESS